MSNIRECDVIINVIRCFDDENILHVNNKVNPIADLEVIELELQLADISTLEKIILNNEKKIKTKNEEAIITYDLAKKLKSFLESGKMAIDFDFESEKENKIAKQFCLLTAKKAIYVANVKENDINGN